MKTIEIRDDVKHGGRAFLQFLVDGGLTGDEASKLADTLSRIRSRTRPSCDECESRSLVIVQCRAAEAEAKRLRAELSAVKDSDTIGQICKTCDHWESAKKRDDLSVFNRVCRHDPERIRTGQSEGCASYSAVERESAKAFVDFEESLDEEDLTCGSCPAWDMAKEISGGRGERFCRVACMVVIETTKVRKFLDCDGLLREKARNLEAENKKIEATNRRDFDDEVDRQYARMEDAAHAAKGLEALTERVDSLERSLSSCIDNGKDRDNEIEGKLKDPARTQEVHTHYYGDREETYGPSEEDKKALRRILGIVEEEDS